MMKIFGTNIITRYLLITVIFVTLLIISGYFKIGFLSDDYINFYSANISSISDKFTSNVIYFNHLLLRPLWFLSLSSDIFINKTLNLSTDVLVVSRIHNLLLYLLFAFILSFILYLKTNDKSLSLLLYALVLVFPNNLHSLLWVVCRNDIQFGIFGLLSLLFLFLYKENYKPLLLISSVIFFGIALLFKETAIIFPFIIILVLYRFKPLNKTVKFKDYIFHFILLALYASYKLFFLNSSTSNILNHYSFNIAERMSVLPKALFSVFSSTDYMSLNYYFTQYSLFDILSFMTPLIISFVIIILINKEKPIKLIIIFLLFIVTIIPYVVAGYFRPQLIIVPFSILWLFILSDILSLNTKTQSIVKLVMVVLVFVYVIESYARINDYKNSYSILRSNVVLISDKLKDHKETPVFVFVPSRLQQTYILDNVSAAYNYFKYNDFVMNDTIKGFVNYAALDFESINAEIFIQIINDSTVTAICSGKTQYFYNIDNNSISDYENDYIKCEFQKDSVFINKCKKVKLTLKNMTKNTFVALTNNRTVYLNSN